MDNELVSILSPILALVTLFILHAIIHRIFHFKSILLSFIVSFIFMLLIFIVFSFVLFFIIKYQGIDFIYTLFGNLIILICLSYFYINLLNIGEVSLRIKLLSIINESDIYGIPLEELILKYNSEIIIKLRIDRLIKNGQLIEQSNKYFLGKKRQIYIVNFYLFWRNIMFR
ncbi:MAG: hypothetical protein CVV44_23010 [Spirochaetae bacterium HGW-Spirochaetae-1]|jgi:hypothetical protein|nr:MAG: hypothetical protein CVV44_23010 [Spirochaetae bacterium HGW-Spirochaetae-1]